MDRLQNFIPPNKQQTYTKKSPNQNRSEVQGVKTIITECNSKQVIGPPINNRTTTETQPSTSKQSIPPLNKIPRSPDHIKNQSPIKNNDTGSIEKNHHNNQKCSSWLNQHNLNGQTHLFSADAFNKDGAVEPLIDVVADATVGNITTLEEIEQQILTVWESELDQCSSDAERYTLLNAPVDERRNMLSWSAFNSMPNLAEWAVSQGANINAADGDNATMLKMAVINKNLPMVQKALELGASPNLLSGSSDTPMTMLSNVPNWSEHNDPQVIELIRLAAQCNGLPSDSKEREALVNRLDQAIERDPNVSDSAKLRDYLLKSGTHNSSPSTKGPESSSSALLSKVDQHLVALLSKGSFDMETLENIIIGGKNFIGFLSFNGFNEALEAYFRTFKENDLVTFLTRWDTSGNNALFGALKSKNETVVTTVLNHLDSNINDAAPDDGQYYSFNRNARALDIAISWRVSSSILDQLLLHGALPEKITKPLILEDSERKKRAVDLFDAQVRLEIRTQNQADEAKSAWLKSQESL